MITTIQLDSDLKQKLDSLKVHRRESYNDLIERLVENCSFGDVEKESLIETLEVMSDPETMRNIADGMERINDKSNWVSWEKIKKDLELNV